METSDISLDEDHVTTSSQSLQGTSSTGADPMSLLPPSQSSPSQSSRQPSVTPTLTAPWLSVQKTQFALSMDDDGPVDVSVGSFWPPQPSGSQAAQVTSTSIPVPTYYVESNYDLPSGCETAQSSRQADGPVPTYDVDLSSDSKPSDLSSVRSLVGLALETIAGGSKSNDLTLPSASKTTDEAKGVAETETTATTIATTTVTAVGAVAPKIEESRSEESHRAEVASPEPNCAICLGKMQNKSFTNSCFHQFCFTCLLEWSKVKPECPLCKQPFKSIVHNVRSMEDYDQYHLRTEEFHSWDNPDGRRFRYRSTLTSERRREATLGRLLTTHHAGGSRSAASATFVPVRHLYSTSDFRRYIYERGLSVHSSPRTTRSIARYREATPEFYTANPACTHRLLPWLNRELNALNYGHQTAFLLELITSLVLRFHIESPEFGEHLRPYFLNNTEHFIHEFYNFARSPYDMGDYDRHATYPNVTSPANSGNDDGGDGDVVFLSQRRDPLARPSNIGLSMGRFTARQGGVLAGAASAGRTAVLNRARDFLLTLQRQNGSVSAARASATSSSGVGEPSQSRSPQPGPSGVPYRSHGGPARSSLPPIDVNVFCSSSSDDDSADDEALLRSIINQRTLARLRVQQMERKPTVTIDVEDEEEEDDCLIVDVVGKTPRSPVAVIMLSDSDDEVQVDHQTSSSSEAATTSSSSPATSQVTPPPASNGVQSPPVQPQPQPPIKIKLSLTKAGLAKASLAASRAARRQQIYTYSSPSSAGSADRDTPPQPQRTPSPYSWPTASEGSSEASGQQRSSSPEESSARSTPASSPDSSEQPAPRRTIRSKVVRLKSVVAPRPDASSGGGGESSSSGCARRSSSTRSREDDDSDGSPSPKIRSLVSRRRHRVSNGKEQGGDQAAAATNDDSSSKSCSPRKKLKKHKHHKGSGKRKHRSKVSKKEDGAENRT